jgi:hypothetical protein
MYYLSVVAVFKNESHILEEWLQHYIYHGVDHFYLINDGSTDEFMSIIQRHQDRITLFNNTVQFDNVGRQSKIYNTYVLPLKQHSKWFAVVDLDEFLYCPTGIIDLKDVLRNYEKYTKIKIDWHSFGSNNHLYQPSSVVEGFTRRAPCKEGDKWYSYKMIVRNDELRSFGIHEHTSTGEQFHARGVLVINHYQLQSLDWFLRIKGTRGDVNRYYDANQLQRNKEHFEKTDNNEIDDLLLYEQNKHMIDNIKRAQIHTQSDDVTVVLTACNRPRHLDATLASFVKMNTYPIQDIYIIDDSGAIGCNDSVVAKYADKLPIKHIYNPRNIGQVESIDKVYSYVRTKWIFHCEEDWQFLQPGFIEKSMNVFCENPDEKIYTVWLRPHNSTSGHPIVKDDLGRGYYLMKKDYIYKHYNEIMVWAGITFNPGLRKTVDCLRWHPYYTKCDKAIAKGKEYVGEYAINAKYRDDGYYAMILADPSGHVTHIGWGHHIPRFWD